MRPGKTKGFAETYASRFEMQVPPETAEPLIMPDIGYDYRDGHNRWLKGAHFLFDLKKDPNLKNNIADENPDHVRGYP